MKRVLISCLVLFCVLAHAQELEFKITADHADALYRCGEEAVLTIAAAGTNGQPVASGQVKVMLDNWSDRNVEEKTIDLAQGNPFTVKGRLDKPGFLRLRVKSAEKDAKSKTWGVGYDPQLLRKASPSPADFDSFWAESMKRLDATTSPEPTIVRIPEKCTKAFDFFRISFNTFGGRRVYGMLTIPTDKSKSRNGKFPVRFHVPSAGEGIWTGSLSGAPDAICMMITVHTLFETPFGLEEIKACHRKNREYLLEKYGIASYAVAGLDKGREEYYFYYALVGINRGVNWLASRPDVDLSDFTYLGGSQGGGFGLYLLGLNKHFTRGVLYVPGMSDLMGYKAGRASGWPRYDQYPYFRKDGHLAAAEKNAPYFDGANFAERITCPVRVTVGFADTICPPDGVYAAYNHIASKDKKIYDGIGRGHGGPQPELRKELEDWLRKDGR